MLRSRTLSLIGLLLVPFIALEACESGETDSTTGSTSSAGGAITGATTSTTTTSSSGGSGPTTSQGGSGATGGSGGAGGTGGAGGAGDDPGTVVLHETFNDASQFTITDSGGTATTFHSDGADVYFGISDGLGGGLWNGDAAPNDSKAYTGFMGNYLTAENIENGGPASVRLEWSGLDVTNLTALELSIQLAEFNDLNGHIDQDDFIRVEVQLDGGGYTKILELFANTANDLFREDVGLDGSADGDPLSQVASTWTKSVAGTGASLDVRLSFKLDGDQEDIGVDNLRVTGM